jgi:hypothetical protein
VTETAEFVCDLCGGPLGREPWRGFFPFCSKCEMETIHDDLELSSTHLEMYNRLRDLRNTLADLFRELEREGPEMLKVPIIEVIEQIQDISETFYEEVIKPADVWEEA